MTENKTPYYTGDISRDFFILLESFRLTIRPIEELAGEDIKNRLMQYARLAALECNDSKVKGMTEFVTPETYDAEAARNSRKRRAWAEAVHLKLKTGLQDYVGSSRKNPFNKPGVDLRQGMVWLGSVPCYEPHAESLERTLDEAQKNNLQVTTEIMALAEGTKSVQGSSSGALKIISRSLYENLKSRIQEFSRNPRMKLDDYCFNTTVIGINTGIDDLAHIPGNESYVTKLREMKERMREKLLGYAPKRGSRKVGKVLYNAKGVNAHGALLLPPMTPP